MIKAEASFGKLVAGRKTASDAIDTMSKIAEEIRKSPDMSDLWSRIERRVNRGNPISIKGAERDFDKLKAAFSMFYEALNTVDGSSKSTQDVSALKAIYDTTNQFISNYILPNESTTDQRAFLRITGVITNRFSAVASNFNDRLTRGEVAGFELPF